MYIIPKKRPGAEINNAYINSMAGEMITAKAVHHHNVCKKYTPWLDEIDNTVAGTGFVDELKIKIGAQIMLIYNVDTLDGLSSGQLRIVQHAIKTKEGKLDKIIIKFNKPNIGKDNQQKFPMILKDHPGCSVIERVAIQYSICDSSGDVGSKATVFQFPVRLSKATTAHKVQGLTIPAPAKVVNPSPWEQASENLIKIVALNCMGMVSDCRFDCIKTDQKLLEANIIHLSEISLTKDMDTSWKQIQGYEAQFGIVGRGKGMVTFIKNQFHPAEDIIEDELQITKCTSLEVDSISCYWSSGKNISELTGDGSLNDECLGDFQSEVLVWQGGGKVIQPVVWVIQWGDIEWVYIVHLKVK